MKKAASFHQFRKRGPLFFRRPRMSSNFGGLFIGRTGAGLSPVRGSNSVTRVRKSNARRWLPMASIKRLDFSSVAITLRFSSVMAMTFGGFGKRGVDMETA